MIRIFLVIIYLFLGITIVNSQDLIVTENGDSLNCKITEIKKDYIHFIYKYESEVRSTLLPVWKINYYKQGFYPNSEIANTVVKGEKNKMVYSGNYQKVRLSFNGGYSHLVAKISEGIPPDFKDYYKELRSGTHLGAGVGIFISESIGFGARYSHFKTKNEIRGIYAVNNYTGQVITGNLKDDITINYIGPAIYSRFYSRNKMSCFLANFSIGYLGYKDNAEIIEKFLVESSTIGVELDLEADFMIDKNIALGFGFGYVGGSLTKYDQTIGGKKTTIKLDPETPENISRIDLSVGLRLCF
jgi:hypothetical protein